MKPTLEDIWLKASSSRRNEFLITASERYRYSDIIATMQMLAHNFDERGILPGERILICARNDYAISATFLAAVFHGLVPINLSPDVKADRATAILRETAPKLLVAEEDISNDWGMSCDVLHVSSTRSTSFFGGKTAKRWPCDGKPPTYGNLKLPSDTGALAYLLFTSGSTASPSGVMLSRGNLLANITTVGNVLQISAGDRQFVDLPMAHTDGLIHGPVLAFCRQATVVRAGMYSQSNMEKWLNVVRQERCTHFMTVPYVWKMICKFAEHDDYFDGPEMKMLISSAGRITPSLWLEIERRFSKPVVNEYGMTETVMAALHAGKFDKMGARGSLGRSNHCETKINPLDASDSNTGELLLRGHNICLGYWNDPTRTADSFDDDGWFRTGDIVTLCADGSFDLVGRSKTMINSAGMTISPDEIDEALVSHPHVESALTVGISDPDFGEIAVSGVELAQQVESIQLIEFLRKKLELRKVPKHIFALLEIPRGASGKPEIASTREILKEMLHADQKKVKSCGKAGVQSRILAVAAQTFASDIDDISLKSGPDDIAGWDSFSHINFIFALEDEFSQRFPAKKVMGIQRLEDVVALIDD